MALLGLTLLACGPKGSPKAASTSDAANVDAASAAPAPEVDPESGADDASAGLGPEGEELFDYAQDKDTLRFRSPNVVLFRRAFYGPKSCKNELNEEADTWTGPDVERAFRDADVAKALRGESTYLVEGANAKLTVPGGSGSIRWVSRCDDCSPEPSGVKHFREVMQTVTSNRRVVCP